MIRITKKLKSQNGASILMAMVLFLICGFVAAVTLGSAVTNAQKYTDQRHKQQSYLSVSSAACLLRDILGGKEFTGEEDKWIYHCKEVYSEYSGIDNFEEDRYEVCDHLKMKKENEEFAAVQSVIANGLYTVYRSEKRYVESQPFNGWTQNITIEPPADDMFPVEAVVTIDSSYRITIALRAVEPDADSENDEYAMTLSFTATAKDSESSINSQCDVVHNGTKLVKQDDGTYEEESFELQYSENEHYTNTTAITLSNGDIRKGAKFSE